MPALHRFALLLLISLLIALLFWTRALLTVEYPNLDALNTAQRDRGFVPIGRFGDSWPATVIEESEGFGHIEFVRANGQPHLYRGFDGYRLQMLRLEGKDSEEMIVVYRSAETTTREGD